MSGIMAALIGSVTALGEVAISNVTASDIVIDPATATASYTLTSAGSLTYSGGSGTWLSPQAGMDQFEVRATVTSGFLSSGTTGSWLNPGTTRTWTGVQTGEGLSSAIVTVEIRLASSGVVQDTATVTFSAEVTVL